MTGKEHFRGYNQISAGANLPLPPLVLAKSSTTDLSIQFNPKPSEKTNSCNLKLMFDEIVAESQHILKRLLNTGLHFTANVLFNLCLNPTSFCSSPKKGSNPLEGSKACVPLPPLFYGRLLLSVPDLRLQLGALKLPAGRTELPDGSSVNAARSASAQRSKAAALCCS